MSPDHPLTPLLRELCPKRYPKGNIANAEPALDPIELYELACRLGARGVVVLPPDHPLRTGIATEAFDDLDAFVRDVIGSRKRVYMGRMVGAVIRYDVAYDESHAIEREARMEQALGVLRAALAVLREPLDK